jgi:hypothetical protein
LFGWQTFKRIGASLTINRVYKFVLTLSITIQLALFFTIATIALWIDQLYHGDIGKLASFKSLYEGVSIATIIVSPVKRLVTVPHKIRFAALGSLVDDGN